MVGELEEDLKDTHETMEQHEAEHRKKVLKKYALPLQPKWHP
jgi:hypothetical protein